MNARLEAFKTSLASKTDEELFLAYRSIEDAKKGAKTGNGDGESEDLFYKGLQAEAEIIQRHPDELMLAYHRWLVVKPPGAHSGGNGRAGDGTVRASTGNSASWAHDV